MEKSVFDFQQKEKRFTVSRKTVKAVSIIPFFYAFGGFPVNRSSMILFCSVRDEIFFFQPVLGLTFFFGVSSTTGCYSVSTIDLVNFQFIRVFQSQSFNVG
jgi:hypothetical protein